MRRLPPRTTLSSSSAASDVYKRQAQEGKRINDTLLAFQEKFELKLKGLDNRLQKQHDDFSKEVNENFDMTNQRLEKLDEKIEEEKADRIKQQEDQFKALQEKLQSLQDQIDVEREERTEGEKNLLQKLADEAYNLNEGLDKEKTERIFKAKELRDYAEYELHKLQKLNEEFNEKTRDEFMHVTNNLEKEMINRFAHQDQIVDNLSNVVKTIQETLKVIGKDV
eukprot:TRINITY_DN12414_c0_g1_i4.p1 TRINITY_DN12414_c0_g1~~TRINITY_DN12414_c0_g1_i4.p1  ORF type:complete len:223 (-),score=53.88 TRINITY_DN12414_c0_g1_i4:160-828(-)